MRILIVYYSGAGHTRKVAELVKEKLVSRGHDVLVRSALTASADHLQSVDMLLIGTPVHGYILFGQKPSREVRDFLATALPENLEGLPVIGFGTYLFFPRKALKRIQTAVEFRSGKIIDLLAKRRTQIPILADEIVQAAEEWVPAS
ncbi:MAG: flavodoxin family protein [Candidatus Heimdallarchaeota archaeon]